MIYFAAPPPDYPASFQTEDVEFIRSGGDFDIQTIEVQEFSNVYSVENERVTYQVLIMNQEGKHEFSKPLMIKSYYNCMEEINRPPKNNIITGTFPYKQY